MELVWNDFIETWSLEQYFEGERRHDFVTGANGGFARWGKDSVSGDSQAEENENRSGNKAQQCSLSLGRAVLVPCWRSYC